MALSVFAVVPFSASAAEDTNAQTGDGDITEIKTVEDLYMVNLDLAGSYKLMNDIDLSEATAQGGDWDFDGRGWEPIGSNGIYSGSTPFTGTFDGNGYEIKGLRINVNSLPSGTGTAYVGLFANNAGTIKNLTVSGSVSASAKTYNVGAVAGYNSGVIENCANATSVSVSNARYAGGITGYTATESQITRCKNTSDIYCGYGSYYENIYSGGISGCSEGAVSECYNSGMISSKACGEYYSSGYKYAYAYSSGITFGGSIINCYNTGNISATNNSGSYRYVGGISARSGTISNCYNTGTATKAISYGAVTNCYFLSGSGADSTGAKLLTASQMKQLDAFKGFDFENTWFIDLNAEYNYPQLRNNKQIADSTPSEGYHPTIVDGIVEIRTVKDLNYVSNDLAGNYKLMNDIDLSEATAEGGDWDFGGRGWEPIGSNGIYSGSTPFTGTFDGNGYEIKGLQIRVNSLPSGTGTAYVGLFANNAGTIKNLTVSGSVSASAKTYNVGAVAGYNSGVIENCANATSVSVSNARYAGGITGYTATESQITRCKNTSDIYCGYGSYYENIYSGGISGCSEGAVSECYNSGMISSKACGEYYSSGYKYAYAYSSGITFGGSIINCYNTGNISATNNSGSYRYVGGISAGTGTISNCYNTGTATKAISYGAVTNCYFLSGSGADSTGAKLLTASQMKQLDAFKGFDFENTWFIDLNAEYNYPQLRNNKQIADSTPSEGYHPTIVDGIVEIRTVKDLNYVSNDLAGNYKLMNDIDLSEATAEGGDWDFGGRGWEPIGSNGIYSGSTPFTGTFDGNGYEIKGLQIRVNSLPSGTGTAYVGLFANNAGTIKNLTVSGSVSASAKTYNVGAVAGYNSGVIENCANATSVSVSNARYAGGITGYTATESQITRCKNTSDIYCGYGSYYENIYSGGISGCSEGAVSECYNSGMISSKACGEYYSSGYKYAYAYSSGITFGGSIINCYNTGNISATNNSGSYRYVGGISARSGTISNCYNTGTATKAISYGAVTNCYFLSGSGADSTGAKLLTASQMKQLDAFKGFDFENTWFIDLNAEYNYPQLRNNKQIADSTPSEGYHPTIVDGIVEIRTVKDLNYVSNDLAGNYKLMNDIDLSEATAEGGDWDFGGRGWEPIGSNGIYSGSTPFTGTFDGNGYEIKGLQIRVNSLPSGTGTAYVGLFANNAGTIKNLTVSGSVSASAKTYNVGAVAGYNSGVIENCANATSVSVSNARYAGGITGYTATESQITRCKNTSDIYCGYGSYYENIYSGGISGCSEGAVSECYNSGMISSKACGEYYSSGYKYAYAYSSGITFGGSIINCYNTGNISATNNSGSYRYVGGISAGTGTISNCYNTGTATKAISYGTVTNCYFLSGSGADTTGAKSLTAGQMKLKALYGGFDFENIWFIEPQASYPYPQLINNNDAKHIEHITIEDMEINNGATEAIEVTFDPEDTTDSKKITWVSSDETIASIDSDGNITGHKCGTVTVTATTVNGIQTTFTVNVVAPITEISFVPDSETIARGTKKKLNLVIVPEDTSDTYEWSSSDTEVATVDKYGTVTARKIGTAVISVTTSRGMTAECNVTVNSPATAISLSKKNLSLFVDKEYTLTAALAPFDVTDSVTWTTSDPAVATVDNGKVVAVGAGNATITATADSGVFDTCEVTVESDISKTNIQLEYDETEFDYEMKEPSVEVYFNNELLIQDTDYRIEYDKNTDAGEATVTVYSLKNDTVAEKHFTITPVDINKCDIQTLESVTAVGNDFEYIDKITYKSVQLFSGIDYTVSNEYNTATGIVTFTVTGINNFAGTATLTAKSPFDDTSLIGDVNDDGVVDVLDAAAIQKYAVGKSTMTPEQLYNADVNNDGNVDVLDAAEIQKYSVGKITEFKKKA